MSWKDEAVLLSDESEEKNPSWMKDAIPVDAETADIPQQKPTWMQNAVPIGDSPTEEEMGTPAYKVADMLTNNVANKAYAVAVAKNTPQDQRDKLLDAVSRLAREKQSIRKEGTVGKALLGVFKGSMNLGETILHATGLESATEDQRRFAHKLHSVWNNADPLHDPEASWYSPQEAIVSAAEMAPQLYAAGGAGKALGASAKALGAGSKLVGLAGEVGSAASFAPEMYENTYDSLLEKGVTPSTARWAAATSAGLQSALFAGLPKKLLPKSWTGEAVSRELADSITKRYAKTVLIHGPTVMAGSQAIDEAVQDFSQGKTPEVTEYIKNAANTYKQSIGPMAVLGLHGIADRQPEGNINLKQIKQERTNSEILKAVEDNIVPSRAQWKDWGLPGGNSRSDRYAGIRKLSETIKEAQKQPEEVSQPTAIEEQQPQVDDTQNTLQQLQSPSSGQQNILPAEIKNDLPTEKNTLNVKQEQITPEVTGIKGEIVDSIRTSRGEKPIPGVEPEKQTEWLNSAKQKIDQDPDYPNKIVKEIQDKPRNLSDEETAALQLCYRKLNGDFSVASDKLFKANESGNSSEITKAQEESNSILKELHAVEDVAKATGREWGRSGVARQMLLQADFTPATLIRRARVAKGGAELNSGEISAVKEISDNIEKWQSNLDKGVMEPKRGFIKQTVKSEMAKKKVDEAWVEFKAAISGKSKENIITSESGALNIDAVVSGVKLAKAYANLGVVTVEEFLANTKGILGDEFEKHKDSLVAAWKQHTDGTLEQRTRKTINSLNKVIFNLENEIKDGTVGLRKKPEPISTPEIIKKRERIIELRKQRDELRNADKINISPEEKKSVSYTKTLEKRLAEIQRKISESDFSKKEVNERILTKEQVDLKFKINEEKAKFKSMEESLQRSQRTALRKVVDVIPESLNASRAILTSMDLSAVLRQGGISVFSHPIMAAKAMPVMFKAFASRKGEFETMEEIRNRPNARLYEQSKLAVTTTEGKLSGQEEAFMGRWAKSIPGVAGSERAYVTFLNRMRADVFDSMVSTLGKKGKVSTEEAKTIANYVNVSTGRGNLGPMSAAAVPMATIFFSPRYAISRFQYILGQPAWNGNARTRSLIAKEYARALTGIGTFYGMIAISNYFSDDKHQATVELNPQSSDFGKIKIGDTRIDPLAGLSQTTVLLTRLITGETKRATGEVAPLRDKWTLHGGNVPYNGGTILSTSGRFLRNKLSPWLGSGSDIISGVNVVGDETTASSLVKQSIIPLSFRDIYDAMQADGVPRKTALSLLVMFGMGSQKYESAGAGDFAYKISQHKELKGRNKKTHETFDYTNEVAQIITQAKKMGITKPEMVKALYQRLSKEGYGIDAISNAQDRLQARIK